MALTFEELKKGQAPQGELQGTLSGSMTTGKDTTQGTGLTFDKLKQQQQTTKTEPEEKKPGILKSVGGALISGEKKFGESIGQAIAAPLYQKQAEENNAKYMKAGNDMVNLAKKTLDPVKRETYMNRAQEYFDKAGQGIQDIVGELKTAKQVLGEAGEVALDVATAGTYGAATKGLKTAQIAKPLLEKTVPTVVKKAAESAVTTGAKELSKKAATGAAIGYGYDVAGNLQDGKDLVESFTPGAGTLLGAATPLAIKGVSKTTKGVKEGVKGITDTERKAEKIISKREKELEELEGSYAKIRKAGERVNLSESRKRVSATDVLADSIDDSGTIRTTQPGGAVEQYREQTIGGIEDIVRKNLEQEGSSISKDVLREKLIQNIEKNRLIKGSQKTSALKKIEKELEGYTVDEAGNIPLTELQDAKTATYQIIGDFATPATTKTYQKVLGNGLKEAIEETSSTNVKEVNKELGKFMQDIKYLEMLDGRKVKGGKAGKYFAQISGNLIGGAFGNLIGGPFGMAAGTIIGGEAAGKLKGRALQKTLAGKTGKVAKKSTVLEEAAGKTKTVVKKKSK